MLERLRGVVVRFWRAPLKRGHALLAFTVLASVFYASARVVDTTLVAPDTSSLEIASLITKVRCELGRAETDMRKRGELSLFELQDFEMEINFVIRKSGSLQATVAGVGGDLGGDNERVQKLLLHWKAKPEQVIVDVDPNTVSVEINRSPQEEPCATSPRR